MKINKCDFNTSTAPTVKNWIKKSKCIIMKNDWPRLHIEKVFDESGGGQGGGKEVKESSGIEYGNLIL